MEEAGTIRKASPGGGRFARLSPLDLSYLQVESPAWPCHYSGLGILEGWERILIDGADEPNVHGTGGEDYFNGICRGTKNRADLLTHLHRIEDIDREGIL